jgi:hypothetical protein
MITFLRSSPSEIGGVNFNDFKMVYIPSHSAYPLPLFRDDPYEQTEWWGGISDFQLDVLDDRRDELVDYINNRGGGLLAMAQDSVVDVAPYSRQPQRLHAQSRRRQLHDRHHASAAAVGNLWHPRRPGGWRPVEPRHALPLYLPRPLRL